MSGYEREELLGKPHNLVHHPDMPGEAFRNMWVIIANGQWPMANGQRWQALVKNRRKSGDLYWGDANATPIRREGKIVGYLSVRAKSSA